MTYKGKYFKGQLESESLVCFFRQHWITLLNQWGILIILSAISLITLFNTKTIVEGLQNQALVRTFFFIGYLSLLGFTHFFFMRFLNYFLCTTIVTDQRVIEHKISLFLSDATEIIQMNQIQDIEHVLRGILPNILRYGEIKIIIASSSNAREITHVPDGKFYFRTICKLRDENAKAFARFMHQPITKEPKPALPEVIQIHTAARQYSSMNKQRPDIIFQ